MPNRFVGWKSRKTRTGRIDHPADNVTAFPISSIKNSASAEMADTLFDPADDNESVRPIDAIADRVVAARYISADGQDRELNRLLDLVLLRIGRIIAALDRPIPRKSRPR
jgi:hypothetical protein